MSADEEAKTKGKSIEEIVDDIAQETKEHVDLLELSKGKDVIVLIGNTGAGKSATLDMLVGKELVVGKCGNIMLKDKSDRTAMAIGETCCSMTRYPASIEHEGLLFFDLPGIRDTGGIACDLINAAFIKSILVEAKSVKVMFFVSEGDVKGTKAELFKSLLTGARDMFDKERKILTDSSLLIFTKRTLGDDFDLGEFLLESVPKSYHEMLRNWIDNDRLFQIKSPVNKEVCTDGRAEILEKLHQLSGQNVSHVNIDALYPSHVDAKLKDVFGTIFDKELKSFFPRPDTRKLSSLQEAIILTKGDSGTDDDYSSFWKRFSTHLESISAVKVLKPLSEKVFKEALKSFQESKSDSIKARVSEWESQSNTLSVQVQSEIDSRISVLWSEKEEQKIREYSCGPVKNKKSCEDRREFLEKALSIDMKPIFIDVVNNDSVIQAIINRDPGPNKQLVDERLEYLSKVDLSKIRTRIHSKIQESISDLKRQMEMIQIDKLEKAEAGMVIASNIVSILSCIGEAVVKFVASGTH